MNRRFTIAFLYQIIESFRMFRKFHRADFTAGLLGLIALVFWPFHDGVQRYGLIFSLSASWGTGLGFVWRRKISRAVLLALPVLAAIPFLLPTKPLHPDRLRMRYIAAMKAMECVRSIWGGEGHHGTDCSGLPRRALRDALWQEGMENGNGAAFREWAQQ